MFKKENVINCIRIVRTSIISTVATILTKPISDVETVSFDWFHPQEVIEKWNEKSVSIAPPTWYAILFVIILLDLPFPKGSF